MQQLEDILETLESTPQLIRDKFTRMREYDLSQQNTVDKTQKRANELFSNALKMTVEERDAEYKAIMREFQKCKEDADEKLNIAEEISTSAKAMVSYMNREIAKVEMRNPEVIQTFKERSYTLPERSLSLPEQPKKEKENRSFNVSTSRKNSDKHSKSFSSSRVEKRRNSNCSVLGEKKIADVKSNSVVADIPAMPITSGSSVSLSQSYSGSTISTPAITKSNNITGRNYIGNLATGGSAIAAAVSQAIVATQSMQQGRRTASLKASFEAFNPNGSNSGNQDSGMNKVAGAAQTAITAIQDSSKKSKKKITAPVLSTTVPNQQPITPVTASSNAVLESDNNTEWICDPSEPRYCICNQVSYGDMVACDNASCPLEWFHYPCVGITEPPEGKWFCPRCTPALKKRSNRKN